MWRILVFSYTTTGSSEDVLPGGGGGRGGRVSGGRLNDDSWVVGVSGDLAAGEWAGLVTDDRGSLASGDEEGWGSLETGEASTGGLV